METSSLKHYTYFLFKNFILLHYLLHFGGKGLDGNSYVMKIRRKKVEMEHSVLKQQDVS